MATIHTLGAKKRELSGRGVARRLRRTGRVPGVIYGAHQENYALDLDARELLHLLHSSAGEHMLVSLNIDGAREQNKLAILQDVQHNALNGDVMHVDFHAVREDEMIEITVPVALLGEPVGVSKGGLLDRHLHEVSVRCLPRQLPDVIEVDVSGLDLGQALHVAEIVFPEGVEPAVGGDIIVAMVEEPRAEEPLTEAESGVEGVSAEA
ncbi:MAG TPA: 50S ribosomal protein L25 [Verrucomicrobiales bacterium]|nr:50S ribosomal protein L25 [Verrucomicrobiales bacterium]